MCESCLRTTFVMFYEDQSFSGLLGGGGSITRFTPTLDPLITFLELAVPEVSTHKYRVNEPSVSLFQHTRC